MGLRRGLSTVSEAVAFDRPAYATLYAMKRSVEKLLEDQFGVVTRRQLVHDCGLTDNEVTALARSGRLRVIGRALFAAAGAPRGSRFMPMAAQLRCGPSARVVGPRAMSWLDLRGMRRDAPFGILVPKVGRRRHLDVDGTAITVFRDPAPDDRTDRVGPLRVPSPARLMVEATRFLDGSDLRAAVDAGRSAGRPTLRQLHDMVAQFAETYVPAARLRRVLSDNEAFRLESEGEREMRAALGPLARHFEWQVWLTPVIRVDALNRVRRVVLEYDGQADHDSVEGRARDARRDAAIEALAHTVVHVTRLDLVQRQAFRRWVGRLIGV